MSTPTPTPTPTPPRRRYRRLSPQRRWMGDLMKACAEVPVVGADRVLRLGEAASARRAVARPPGWTAILLKAYALVAQRRPSLRQSFIKLPVAHLYEHPHSVATLVVEREWQGATGVFFDQVVAPESMPLVALDHHVNGMRGLPVERVGGFRRQIRFTRLPWPLRRLAWWIALRGSGPLHARYFGTFSINSITLPRAGVVQTTTPITMSLIHTPLDPSGQMTVTAAFDHRVLDGMEVGRVLGELESAINSAIADELRALADPAPAAAAPARAVVQLR